ncbi:MAG TPA: enoyl-CoA hydratase [Comamonadaceae bacterium]|uniref:enoyl-CoA hydratase-related protein n=1 Tax=Acidovorax sp. 210-6 TaxID=2699468 RepID=UPI0008C9285E|nr:enoyl-CoA hydratase-related protein [Acidovorax sp. 210-6]MCL4768828.1 enoyl-CoA hydratase/isomerase family protein [Burkholderiaceae bacterium]NCU66880.1 enoyl-CoA hydratase [Acidovorax sp. 210-6]OGB45626.1 MAG: enoyl-CoA hydratase [Burkholderiales bacterium RIFCSPLOWO2_12_FULL_65_40]HCE29590.1 enoyl-CoA hydratase [Comamonadaceae bacterium]
MENSSPELIESFTDGVLTLTMNRPERLNALTPAMLDALLRALRQAAADSKVRAVVLTGAGSAFCAGGDVKAMAEEASDSAQTQEERAAQLREGMECSRLLREMPKPTIALARGATAGAGLSLALACDLLLASDNVKMTSAFVKVALAGDFGGSWFLTQRLGARARAFSLLSPVVDAQEALRIGLVDQVIADDALEADGQALARRLAAGPTTTIGHIKANLNCAERGAPLADALDHEAVRQIRCLMTEDHKEAARAFVEKRAPAFAGR